MRTKAQIISYLKLFVGVKTADQPIQLVVERRTLQSQFLRKGFKLTSTGIFIRLAIKDIYLCVIGIITLKVGIFTISGDRREVHLTQFGIEFNRSAKILRLTGI